MVAMEPYRSPQDEGYSEDPLTASMSENGYATLTEASIPLWLMNLPLEERARLVMTIIKGLPTTMVSNIVTSLRPRLYLDFIDRLPAELCIKILGYLDPVSLICTARASHDWMQLALDWKLWEHLYYLEGWKTVKSELQHFQQELDSPAASLAHDRPDSDGERDRERVSKRRATPKLVASTFNTGEDAEMVDVDSVPMPPQQSSLFGQAIVEEPSSSMPCNRKSTIESRQKNEGSKTTGKPVSESNRTGRNGSDDHGTANYPIRHGTKSDMSNLSSMVVRDRRTNQQHLNWQYLYTQRRRLEANWEQEKFINFQIPHPDYIHQAHTECIYTIQHQGRYLVSGSRDKSLRIWDLETRRLLRAPLVAHTASVLCLQFDADPLEDLIVSGSSDSTVILWKFSTGQPIQTLKTAHRESVLNVRFDKHILVTCSKDKTIKIFNRRPLHPGERGYPVSARAVQPVPMVLQNYGFSPSPYADLPVKPAYSMIGMLEGHGAAVNALQIYDDEIVSASGDRNVKIWNWPLQSCTRTFIGHTKGIACVQYDGRRIVSGSSDNEVKVFDKETGLEVASLRSHTALVRTVQAGFGDLPYSEDEDLRTARTVDQDYFKALESGGLSQVTGHSRNRQRNAGSRRPEDIMAYGAKIPPGGGGGPYGRIVSGSYDETVIIWRRDKEGAWKPKHTLRQEDAARTAARIVGERRPETLGDNNPDDVHHDLTTGQGLGVPRMQAFYQAVITQAVAQGPAGLNQALITYPNLAGQPYLASAIAALSSPTLRAQLRQVIQARQEARQDAVEAAISSHDNTGVINVNALTTDTSHLGTGSSVSAGLPVQPDLMNEVPATPTQFPLQPQQNMARVFKLQFDARRIICCSQTPIIVGWDFANGDESIIEASRFFAPVE